MCQISLSFDFIMLKCCVLLKREILGLKKRIFGATRNSNVIISNQMCQCDDNVKIFSNMTHALTK